MITAVRSHGDLSVADDSQLMIIWCALHDACEWHYDSTASCGDCPRLSWRSRPSSVLCRDLLVSARTFAMTESSA